MRARKWLYVRLSRATDKLIIVGSPEGTLEMGGPYVAKRRERASSHHENYEPNADPVHETRYHECAADCGLAPYDLTCGEGHRQAECGCHHE